MDCFDTILAYTNMQTFSHIKAEFAKFDLAVKYVKKASFEDLKRALTGPEIIAIPTDDGEQILDTDASDVGISGVLSQVQDGKERVLSYGSRTLSKSERNNCVTDRELLAVHYFVEYYRQYLPGRRFKVRSDHQALAWLCWFKEPKGISLP